MTWHTGYIKQFLANPGQNDATAYGVTTKPAKLAPGQQLYWRVIGVHHLTGAENHGQHHAFCDVLDRQGNRVNGARINILTNGNPRGSMVIDKPENEPGTNTQMHFNDTLTLYIAGDLSGEQITGLHTRHEDEEAGTTRGHHSYYVAWQLTPVEEAEEPEEPPEPEPPEEPGPEPDWRSQFDERQLKEIEYCRLYDTPGFRHGTDGHNIRLIVAKMARLLDERGGE